MRIVVHQHGDPPFSVAVLHGGPGALGGMAPVARRLATFRGVLEPIQTADSIAGQVDELRETLLQLGRPPVTLIGSSWGAMLGFIVAALHPELVAKLIMVGSGVFDERYATGILATRFSRLDASARREAEELMVRLNAGPAEQRDLTLARLGAIFAAADAYDPLPSDDEPIECRYEIYQSVWSEAEVWRRDGRLLSLGRKICCPVVALHGDHDPHPASGVRQPLGSVIADFRFFVLPNCGHLPWSERQAKDDFYRRIQAELP